MFFCCRDNASLQLSDIQGGLIFVKKYSVRVTAENDLVSCNFFMHSLKVLQVMASIGVFHSMKDFEWIAFSRISRKEDNLQGAPCWPKFGGIFLQVISLPFYFPPGSFSVLGGSDLFFGNLINNSRISVLETLPEIFCAFCPHFELLFWIFWLNGKQPI